MKFALAILLFFSATFAGTFANAPALPNDASLKSTLVSLRQYYSTLPTIEFSYVFKSPSIKDLPSGSRHYFFKQSKGRFLFAEGDDFSHPNTMLSYDELKFYALYPHRRLVISSDPTVFSTYFSSWFTYNPLFNPASYLFPQRADFGLPLLTQPAVWAQAAAMLKLEPAGIRLTSEVEKSTFLISRFSPNSGLPNSINGNIKEFDEHWKIDKTLLVPWGKTTFALPAIIRCEDRWNNTVSPYSYEIALDEPSVKISDHPLDAKSFVIPSFLVTDVYDTDIKGTH